MVLGRLMCCLTDNRLKRAPHTFDHMLLAGHQALGMKHVINYKVDRRRLASAGCRTLSRSY